MPEAYAPCPCGSGKKFKWCCQPFYGEIEKAFQSLANNQLDTAVRITEQLTTQHPDNAEVWGRRAEILLQIGEKEKAEAALAKALEVNPNYPTAYFLQGMLRHNEGEIPGALLLYRKALEHCDPEAHDLYADISASIGQCEMLVQHPIAARAAFEICQRHNPAQDQIATYLKENFGPEGTFPQTVRKAHVFKKSVSAPAGQWDAALAGAQDGKLSAAARAFEELTSANATDAAAWYNLGLTRTWLGDNRNAIEALDKYVELENDLTEAAAAWCLADVLRQGADMAAVCDTLSYLADYQVTDIQRFVECLKTERRIIDVAQQENVIAGGFLDRAMPQAHAHMALFELPRVLGTFVLSPGWFRLLSYDESNLERLREAFQTLAGPALGPPRFDSRPAPLRSVMDRVLTIRFPSGTTEEQAQRFLEGHLQQMFEDQWIQRPLKSLNGITPVDAAGHANLKKKVLGLIQFQEEVATTIMPLPYDFDRLRHKLGLPTSGPKAISPAPTSSDISSMNAAELATLAVDTLSGDELQSAFQAAIRLDATELAARFAQAIVTRPYQGDRFTYFKHLNQVALDNTQMTDALEALDAGLKDDCEHNEGRRRNDYELLRAKTHLRANDAEQANAVFAGLLQRQPDSLDIIGTAAEAMLKVGAKPFAVTFAEQGVAKAKQKGDRDRIGYFQELLDAARR